MTKMECQLLGSRFSNNNPFDPEPAMNKQFSPIPARCIINDRRMQDDEHTTAQRLLLQALCRPPTSLPRSKHVSGLRAALVYTLQCRRVTRIACLAASDMTYGTPNTEVTAAEFVWCRESHLTTAN